MVEDYKQKDVLSTPAHSGTASQRNAAVVEDNTLEQVCGTRRFARLAEESATVLKGANLFSRKELFADDIQDFKRYLEESLYTSVELSGVTDVEDSKSNEEEHGDLREDVVDDLPGVGISKIELGNFIGAAEQIDVDVFEPESDYVLRESISDFQTFRKLFSSLKLSLCYYALHGVAGAYARRIIVEELGAKESSLLNCAPKEDFGRGHPDHNLTYARELVARVGLSKSDNNPDPPEFGAAADGDVDHNMDFGKEFFVAPSDFVAIIAAYVVQAISYFPGGLKGVARSMCTLAALDVVAKNTNLIFFEMPTGWKFFGMTTHLEPKLALALRISMDEERVLDAAIKQNRQESAFNLLDMLLSDDMVSGDNNSD